MWVRFSSLYWTLWKRRVLQWRLFHRWSRSSSLRHDARHEFGSLTSRWFVRCLFHALPWVKPWILELSREMGVLARLQGGFYDFMYENFRWPLPRTPAASCRQKNVHRESRLDLYFRRIGRDCTISCSLFTRKTCRSLFVFSKTFLVHSEAPLTITGEAYSSSIGFRQEVKELWWPLPSMKLQDGLSRTVDVELTVMSGVGTPILKCVHWDTPQFARSCSGILQWSCGSF